MIAQEVTEMPWYLHLLLWVWIGAGYLSGVGAVWSLYKMVVSLATTASPGLWKWYFVNFLLLALMLLSSGHAAYKAWDY
jgi:hypothetical protein